MHHVRKLHIEIVIAVCQRQAVCAAGEAVKLKGDIGALELPG